MTKYLRKTFALSETGAKNILKASLCSAFANIAAISVAWVMYGFLMNTIMPVLNGEALAYQLGAYILYTLLVVALLIVAFWMSYNASYFAAYEESAEKRITLAEKLRKLPLSFFGQRDLSDLTTTIMTDAATLEQAFSHYMPALFGSMVSMPIIMIGVAVYNWRMALATMWVIPVALCLVLFTKNFQKSFAKKSKKTVLEYNDKITECVENIRDIKSNNRQDAHVAMVAEQFAKYEKQAIMAEVGVAVPISLATLILKVGIATSVLAGVYLLASGTIDMLVFIAFMMLATRIFEPIEAAFMNIAAIFSSQIAIDRMKVIEETESQEGSLDFKPNGYDVAFESVHFSYDTSEKVLEGLSFVAKQGEVTALVGPSGGGKSTAMKLSARFWDVTEGIVTIGGVDISKIDPEELLKSISIVFQDVTLFNNSVLENIRIGRKDATDAEVIAVAKMANCDEFVNKMPEGYHSFIGENGYNLSGGERQRLSIARALLKDAPIILLDEATSSLDIKNESLVQDAISKLIKEKTVLVIAHRMRTVAGADKIVLIKDGKVEEEGTYQELIAQEGLYKRMVDLQAKSASWNIV
ncbi:ABC transporter ATP-binding protein [Chakrabartyella piscis]|uniref:ABC transporter ATP-binding protein n=1 Tax=Chakrabartyella piscis TaxID=2918914 RepID=UPI002958463E|nr:ABC transporter ATP-binding protein [Chakrabartyella piscis]